MTTLYQPPEVDAIDKCVARLAVAFQRQIDAATVKVYRETMADLPLWAIEGAELQLRRKGGDFFPSAPAWHQVAEILITDRQRDTLTQSLSDDLYECETCRDTGWCSEVREDQEVCIPCSCRAMNTRWQQLQTSGRKLDRGRE